MRNRVLFCDTSYCIFYRFYAVSGWYRRQNEGEFDVKSALENSEFMAKYDKMFEKMLVDLMKKYKVEGENLILAKDCSRENIWRSKLYAEYKCTRDDRTSSFNGDIFKHTFNILLPLLKVKYGFHIISNPSLEADDIIALSSRYLIKKKGINDIIIITNDNDYVQLYKYKEIEIYNLQNKSLRERVEDVDSYLLYKIIIGDKSDNIKAIAKKVGEKTAKKMVDDSEVLQKYLDNEDVKAAFELNTTLIDFERIPEEYVLDINQKIEEIFKMQST